MCTATVMQRVGVEDGHHYWYGTAVLLATGPLLTLLQPAAVCPPFSS